MSTFKSSKQKGSNLCPVKYFTCTSKVRDKYGNIRGYVIEDESGKSTQISANNLKNALRNNNIHVTNLKLTSDGRLIDKKQGNQTAHSKISQMTQPNNKETLKPEKLVAVYYRMREEELNKYRAKISVNDHYEMIRSLPELSNAELAWLHSVAERIFASCNRQGIVQADGYFGQQAFCCSGFDTITGRSRELVLNGLLDAEYHRSQKDILDFVSDWKICYCVSGNYDTKQIIISLGMCKPYKTPSSSGALYYSCEFSDYQVVLTEQDLMNEATITAVKNLYKEYFRDDKEYKSKLTDTKIEALRYMREEHNKRLADMADAELWREEANKHTGVKIDKETKQPQSRQYTKHSVTQYDNQHYATYLLDRAASALGCGLYHIGTFNGRSVYCSKSSGILAEYGHDAETGIVEPMSKEDEHYMSVITTDNNTERAKGIFSKLKSKKQTEDMFRLCLIESKDRKATELCLCTLHIEQLTGDISVALVLYTGDSVRIGGSEIGVINRTILEKANDTLAKTFISLKRKYN